VHSVASGQHRVVEAVSEAAQAGDQLNSVVALAVQSERERRLAKAAGSGGVVRHGVFLVGYDGIIHAPQGRY